MRCTADHRIRFFDRAFESGNGAPRLGPIVIRAVDGEFKKLPVIPRTKMSQVQALLAEPSLVYLFGKTARRGRLAER